MKCVKESPSKRVYQEEVSCLGPFLTFMSLPFLALVWFSLGDHHFTCFRVDQSAVNCEVFFQPLLPLPSDDYTLQGRERGWNQNRNRDR
jgi:hypothetical protein